MLIDFLLRDLCVIWFCIIWYDIIESRLGLSWFAFGVVWRLLVWFSVICILFGGSQCFWSDLSVICF